MTEPHPEAQELRELIDLFVNGTPSQVDWATRELDRLVGVLVGRLEQKEEALRRIAAISIFDKNAVGFARTKAREALGVPPPEGSP